MKKRKQSKLTVKRISTSPYFKEDFVTLEKKIIEDAADAEVVDFNSSASANVLITNTHTIIEELSSSEIDHCELMIHPNSGYDNFPPEFVKKAPFPILIGNPIRAHAVTNFILSALFSHYSPLPKQASWHKTRQWPRRLLAELNVLILGEGHIGGLLKNSLTPLVGGIQVFDPYKNSAPLSLENIDVVIPACGLNKKNQGFIDRDFLMKLSDDFLLINAARGQLVKTVDLIDVLNMRPRAFAFLDVFEKEPADFGQFKSLENIHLTSHIAGVYSEIDKNTALFEGSVISDFQKMEESAFVEKYKNMLLANRLRDDFLI